MTADFDIINARVPGYDGLQVLAVRDGKIERICAVGGANGDRPLSSESVLDVNGDWISLGGADLQINGALGLAFPEITTADLENFDRICQFLWQEGVDFFLPTLVTTSIENIHRSLEIFADFTPSEPSARPLGVHLEGPCLNPEKRGAHPQEYLRPLQLADMKEILGEFASVVKVITLAPELDPTGDVIPYLRSRGITVSLGHSQATLAQANVAFEQGATMVTHAFNAMPGLHHRTPGLLGAATVNSRVYCGLIADGIHVCPTMVDIFLRSNFERTFLVSDALAPLGLPDGLYPWDDRQIEVTEGTARLLDGTLSGTTLSLLAGVQNLVQWGICDLGKAIALATEHPRQALGLSGIAVDRPANLLRWSEDRSTRTVTWRRIGNDSG
ncbi:N-acetylglucosamine-6-phosphate deacetylase [Roseofilum casamattae]|uniref:N-acetylglucosamine-6-phosphate deacetylase n=1 Tax=Roseofilum casamattae BLCC-M143 TaxID=3022442 RepID=A0ABT7BYZ8_9CYAN|nr:N-acetylglucosamine-6-phosphate deacetylase [Roseofilum casamattae]MDJ1183503.1 N-acetylglucosamine-6-phosphate deacetylase [Roseofilum casamattae BLCC-M143]